MEQNIKMSALAGLKSMAIAVPVAIVLSAGSVSCNRELPPVEDPPVYSFEAELPVTKISLESDLSLSWEVGDIISVFDGTDVREYTAESTGKMTTVSNTEVKIDPKLTYYAAYPADERTVFEEEGILMTVDSRQSCSENPCSYSYGIAKTDGTERHFSFNSLVSILAFNVTDPDISKIIISGNNKEFLAGRVRASYEEAYVESVINGSEQIEIIAEDVMATGRHYAAVLPQNFNSGITISMIHKEGTYSVVHIKEFECMGRGIVDLTNLEESRTSETIITTANELKKFLESAASLPSDHKVKLANDLDLELVELQPAESFGAEFDGQGHEIQNWKASRPLFTLLKESAVVKNLRLASSCEYLIDSSEASEAFLVAENCGLVADCTNEGAVKTVSGISNFTESKSIGALVSVNKGRVEGCVNNGKVAIYNKAFWKCPMWVGGVVGKTCPETPGTSVSGCSNSGYVVLHALRAKSPLFVGGVVGGSAATLQTSEYKCDALADYGQILNCSNSGRVRIENEDIASENANNINNHNLGGVIAYFEGSISGCTSTGNVEYESPTEGIFSIGRAAVGGVAGFVSGSVTACNNSAVITVKGTFGRSDALKLEAGSGAIWRECVFGGVVGYAGDNTGSTQISGCSNEGSFSFDIRSLKGDKFAIAMIGGVVGLSKSLVTGCSNSGHLLVASNVHFNNYGGIAGRSSHQLSSCSNSGSITLDNLTADVTDMSDLTCYESYVGGISGVHAVAEYTSAIADCVNSGNVVFKNGVGERQMNATKKTTRIQYVGGVAGLSTGQITATSGNRILNSGEISFQSGCRTYLGGIAGAAIASVLNADNSGNIKVGVEGAGIAANSMVGGSVGIIAHQQNIQLENETAVNRGQGIGNGVTLTGGSSGNVTAILLGTTTSGIGLLAGKINAKADSEGNFYWTGASLKGYLNVTGQQDKVGLLSGGGLGVTKVFCGKEGESCTVSGVSLNGTPIAGKDDFVAHSGSAITSEMLDVTFLKFGE